MSFMDRKNIISEGFFDRLMKLFKQDRKVMKDPTVKKAFKELEKSEKKARDAVNIMRKRYGLPEIK